MWINKKVIIGLVMNNKIAFIIITNVTVKNYGTFSKEQVQVRLESQWVLMMSDGKTFRYSNDGIDSIIKSLMNC